MLRDFWNRLRWRIRRGQHPEAVYLYYDLPLNGRFPRMTKQADVIPWAQKALAGETAAVADGYPPLTDPSAGELQDALEVAASTMNAVNTAAGELEDARQCGRPAVSRRTR